MAWLCRFMILIGLATVVGAAAQSADERELAQYRLTPEVLSKVEAVAQAFAANIEKDPKMKQRLDAQRQIAVLEKKDNLTEAEEKRLDELERSVGDEPVDLGVDGGSLPDIEKQLGKIAPMAAALKTAGMPAREMARFIVSAVQAVTYASVQGRGVPMPTGAAGENVKFAAANQAAIQRINKLLGMN